MPISITNTGYLALSVKDRPIIGWQSEVAYGSFDGDPFSSGASNLWAPETYTFWQSGTFDTLQDPIIYLSPQVSFGVTYVAFCGHNAGNYSNLDAVLEYSTDGSTWNLVDSMSIDDNSPVIFYFDEIAGNPDFRIRFDVDFNVVAGEDFIQVAHARAGIALVLERPEFVGNSPFDRAVEKLTNMSDSGRYLGSTLVSEVRRYNIQQQHNSDTFVREYIEPFLKHCELIGGGGAGPKGSFFYAWRPEEFSDDVYYCHDPKNVTWPSYSRPNKAIGFDWSISGMSEK